MVPRRTLLRGLGLAVATVTAGCNSLPNDGPEPSPTRQRTPTSTETATLTPTPTTSHSSPSPTEPPTESPTHSPTQAPTPSPTPTIAETRGRPALTASAPTELTEVGRAVALSTDTAIVLAEGHGAFVFEQDDGWTQTAVLQPDDAADFGAFNLSAAAVGKEAIIGGPDADPNRSTGMVYLFERVGDEWRQRHRFRAEDDADRNEFGRSVDYDGDRVIVGDAHDPTTMVPWTGDAYVFAGDGTNWTQEAALGTENQDLFGTAVAVAGETALVGAPRATPSDDQVGVVYAYRHDDGWQRQAMLMPAEAGTGGLFGRAIDIDGNLAVIGAPGSESAYVFEHQGADWRQKARVTTTATAPDSRFGEAVAIDDGTVVVGVPEDTGGGRAYVFQETDDWSRPRRLIGQELPAEAEFGTSMAAAGAMALIGAPVFAATSAAYLFDLASVEAANIPASGQAD